MVTSDLTTNTRLRMRDSVNTPAAEGMDGGWSEEDVSYVTLAKAGGRKDLLQHVEYSRPDGQEPVSYSTVDWFAHPSPSPSPPPPPQPPSSLLHWPASLVEVKERKRRKQTRHRKKTSSQETPIKLPKVEPEVNMMQLLAMDYQKEWLKEREQRALEKKRQARERRTVQRRKLEEHTMRARRVCGVEPAAEKPRFIMKRFANVPSRVQLPPLTTATTSLPNHQN